PHILYQCTAHHSDLHSFPTRRSSDLTPRSATVRTHPLYGSYTSPIPGARRSRSRKAWLRGPKNFKSEMSDWTAQNLKFLGPRSQDRKSTRLNSSHVSISYAVFCLKKK